MIRREITLKSKGLIAKFYVQLCTCGKSIRGGRGCGQWLAMNVDMFSRTKKVSSSALTELATVFEKRMQSYGLIQGNSSKDLVIDLCTSQSKLPYVFDHDWLYDSHQAPLQVFLDMISGATGHFSKSRNKKGYFCGFARGGMFGGECYHDGLVQTTVAFETNKNLTNKNLSKEEI